MKKSKIPFSLVITFVFCFLYNSENYAQKTIKLNEINKVVDSIFADKNSIKSPGASVIIIKDKKVLFSKSYGAANLAFSLPFDENTVFPLNAFTEQLVVFSIFLLQKENKISLDDSVNKYLPELGFPGKVTLGHFLNHSSDFPMMSSLRLIAGWDYSDPFTNDNFIKLTKNFSSNLNPDKEFVHNHGGIKFLMMVVEKVSGQSFSRYAALNILKPLGMTNTFIKYKGNLSNVKNKTIGYTLNKKEYISVVPSVFEIMSPKTYTTRSDFQKWMLNIQTKKFHEDIIKKMDNPLTINGRFEKRTYGSYCVGQQQYRYYNYRKQGEFYMRETGDGYSWMWSRFSKEDISVMVIGNLDSYIGSKVNTLTDLIGNYNYIPNFTVKKPKEPIKLSKREQNLLTGTYWNKTLLYSTEISIKDGKLYHSDNYNGFNFSMTPLTKTKFLTPFGGVVEFSNLRGNNKKMVNTIPNGRKFHYDQYQVPNLKNKDKYTGIYLSNKLNISYEIVLENNQLILRRNRKSDLELTPIGNHQFKTPEADFRIIKFNNDVNGFFQDMSISNPIVKDITFNKI